MSPHCQDQDKSKYCKGAFAYDVRCFLDIFDLPTYLKIWRHIWISNNTSCKQFISVLVLDCLRVVQSPSLFSPERIFSKWIFVFSWSSHSRRIQSEKEKVTSNGTHTWRLDSTICLREKKGGESRKRHTHRESTGTNIQRGVSFTHFPFKFLVNLHFNQVSSHLALFATRITTQMIECCQFGFYFIATQKR